MKRLRSGNFKDRLFGILVVCLIGVCVYRLGKIDMDYREGSRAYGSIEKYSVSKKPSQNKNPARGAKKRKKKEKLNFRDVRIDFKKLKQLNEDVIGWILFDGNGISYPVLQGEDNEEYLYVMADLTKNKAGSIFMDALCSANFLDAHTILYGHNMRDLSMFGKLKKYRQEKGYYKDNRYFTIYTPEYIYRYEIFSWYEAAKDDSVYQVGFEHDDAFGQFTEQMKERSGQDTKVEVGKDDQVVTLSTCSAEGKRFVVHGKRIDWFINAK